MKTVHIPKGKFLMGGGSNAGSSIVKIKHDFYPGSCAVTQSE